MTEIFKGLLVDVLNDAGGALDDQLVSMLGSTLQIETLPAASGILSSAIIEQIYNYIYIFAVALVFLKFLYKGFSIWVLWRDGDADNSPQDMLIGVIQAVVIIIAFPTLYRIMANVTVQLADGIMSIIAIPGGGAEGAGPLERILAIPALLAGGIFSIIILFIYVILTVVLYIKLLGRGFELLILRLGVPFACTGLIDSDYGTWKPYMQTCIKSLLTSLIQVIMLSLSMPLAETGHLILALATIGTAFNAPTIMQQFLVPGGRGGGLASKVYTGSMVVRAIRGFAG